MIISKKISSSIAETLSANNIISEQEIPIYSYCLDYIIELFFLFIFAVLYRVFSHKLPETLIFLAVFTPLRSFGGGFHASTPKRCAILSLITFVFVLYSGAISSALTWQWTAAFAISLSVIAVLSPVGTKNRPMTPERKISLKKRCLLFCVILTILYIFFYLHNLQRLYGTLAICMLINLINIVAGYILEKKTTNI